MIISTGSNNFIYIGGVKGREELELFVSVMLKRRSIRFIPVYLYLNLFKFKFKYFIG